MQGVIRPYRIYVEQMVIASLAVRGCAFAEARVFANQEFKPKQKKQPRNIPTIEFLGTFPTQRKQPGRVLYAPTQFNFRAVDAILVYLNDNDRDKDPQKNPKATVMGIQITIASTHTDSERNFFEHWSKLTKELDEYEIKAMFMWVWEDLPLTPQRGSMDLGTKTVRRNNKRLRCPREPGDSRGCRPRP